MKILNSLTCFFLSLNSVLAQNNSTIYKWYEAPFFEEKQNDLQIDNLGQIYTINATNTIIKYKNDGKIWNTYVNNRLGNISKMDVSNPLRIILFYENFQNIISLDNNMAENGNLNLNKLEFGNIRGICISEDNLIWIFDEVNKSLKKIDFNGKMVLEGLPEFDFEINQNFPIHMKAENRHIYFYQNTGDIFIFNLFGNFEKKISLEKGKPLFLINNNSAFQIDGKNILITKLDNFSQKTIQLKDAFLPLSSLRFNAFTKTILVTTDFQFFRLLPIFENIFKN